MQTMKQKRRMGVEDRLKAQLLSGVKTTKTGPEPLTDSDIARIERELKILQDRLGGKKKGANVIVAGKPEAPKDKYFLDIYSISVSKTKHSDRRGKGKGKSRKKSRTVRSVNFVKSVTVQPGLIQAYREGRMGISPRTHSFRVRKDEPMSY